MRYHWDGDELMTSFHPHTHSHMKTETNSKALQTYTPRSARSSVHPTFPLPPLTPSSSPLLGALGRPRAALLGTAVADPAPLEGAPSLPPPRVSRAASQRWA